MSRYLFVLLLLAGRMFAQSCTITSPSTGATVSGWINFTLSLTSAPSAQYVQWILDDSTVLVTLSAQSNPAVGRSPFSYRWNSAFAQEGPHNIKAAVTNGKGGAITSCGDLAFTVRNWGITITPVFPASLANPTISGTVHFDFTSSGSSTKQNSRCNVDGVYVGGTAGDIHSWPVLFDSTELLNGPHVASCLTQFRAADGYLHLGGMQFGFTASNGHTLMGVLTNYQSISLTPGQSATLSAQLQYTDGTTGSGNFTFVPEYACNPYDANGTVGGIPYPYPCVSGQAHPLYGSGSPGSGAQGAAYVTLGSTTSTSTVVTGTSSLGHAIIVVQDTVSGKKQYVNVLNQASLNTVHIGKDGSKLTAFDPVKSIFTTSLFNSGCDTLAQEPGLAAELKRAGLTVYEASGGFLPPHGYATYSSWLSAWTSGYLPCIQNAHAQTGLPIFLRADGIMGQADMHDIIVGPSNSWTNEPMAYMLSQFKSLGYIAGLINQDEVDSNFRTIIPACSMKFSDGSLIKGVASGGIMTWYGGPGSLYCFNNRYTGPTLYVQNNSGSGGTAGMYGSVNLHAQYCSPLNILELGDCPQDSGMSHNMNGINAPTYDVFQTTTSAADGTYTGATDPNLEIVGWPEIAMYPGEGYFGNGDLAAFAQREKNSGILHSWPVRAIADWVTQLFWNYANMADFQIVYWSNGTPACGNGQTFLPSSWGLGPHEASAIFHNLMYGEAVGQQGRYPWWQKDCNHGSAILQPGVPVVAIQTAGTWDYATGGRALNINNITNGVVETSSPHNIQMVAYPNPNPWIRITISGNSGLNGSMYAGMQTDPTHFETWGGGTSGCGLDPSTRGQVRIRGSEYTITNLGGSSLNISPAAPPDLIPGEHIVIHGNAAACAGGTGGSSTWVLDSASVSRTQVGLGYLKTGSGSGGVVLVNDTGNWPDPTYDHGHDTGTEMTTNDLAFVQDQITTAAALGFAGVREYGYLPNVAILSSWPNDGQNLQLGPSPYTTMPIGRQRNWWALSQANLLIKRITPFLLQARQSAPSYLSVQEQDNEAAPWITTGVYSSTYGKLLMVINTSDIVQTVTVNHAPYQTGTNPVSVYHLAYPDFYAQYLSGSLTTTPYTMQPGETIALLYHSGTSSYVQNTPVSFNLASVPGATQVVVRQIYGYPSALNEAGPASSVSCTASPCGVPIDTGIGETYLQTTYLDASNKVLSVGDPLKLN